MAYLLKDIREERQSRRRKDEDDSGTRSSSLFRSVFTTLHGTGGSRSGTTNVSTPSARNTSSVRSSGMVGGHEMGASAQGASRAPAPASSSAALARGEGGSDAELYAKAVDYADIVSIINAPTLPPTRHGFAHAPPPAGVLHTAAEDNAGVGLFPCTAEGPQHPMGSDSTPLSAKSGATAQDDTMRFHRIAEDKETGVEVYSAPVKDFPIHLMRATAIMPCSPSDLLHYMDSAIRPHWDTYLKESKSIRELPASLDPTLTTGNGGGARQGPAAGAPGMAAAIYTRDMNAVRIAETSLAAESRHQQQEQEQQQQQQQQQRQRGATHKGGTSSASQRRGLSLDDKPTATTTDKPSSNSSGKTVSSHASPSSFFLPPSLFRSEKPFAFLPGQRRVALHYLAVRSPVLFVQDRDFEIVVSEAVLPDGTAIMKAFSAPRGAVMPMDPDQTRYVRAVVVLSGIVGRPWRIPTALARRQEAEQLVAALPASLRAVATAQLRAGDRKRRSPRKANSAAAAEGTAGTGAADVVPEYLEYCLLEYFGLVHPLGLIVPQIVNIVISAQTSTLRKMQQFIATHPLESLQPAPLPVPAWRQQRERERREAEAHERKEARSSSSSPPVSPSSAARDAPGSGGKQGSEGGDAADDGSTQPWWKRAKGRLLAKL